MIGLQNACLLSYFFNYCSDLNYLERSIRGRFSFSDEEFGKLELDFVPIITLMYLYVPKENNGSHTLLGLVYVAFQN